MDCAAYILSRLRRGIKVRQLWSFENADFIRGFLNVNYTAVHIHRGVTNRPLADPGQLLFYVAGPPCQGLSSAGLRKGWSDPRTQLYMHDIQAIEKCMPDSSLLDNSDNRRFANNGAIAGAIITRPT